MFYAACALLSSRGIFTKSHSAVHSLFAQHFVKPGLIEIEYSRMLGYAFNLRLNNDYDIIVTSDRDEAEAVLHNAGNFVSRAEIRLREEGLL